MPQTATPNEFDIVSSTPSSDESEFDIVSGPAQPAQPSRGAKIRAESLERRQRAETRRQSGEEPVLQALMGAGRGAISTVQGLASPIRKFFGMQPAEPVPEETTTAGKVGRTAEQVGEFLIPEAGAEKVVSALPKMARVARAGVKAAVTGAGTGVLAAAQGDEHPGRAAALGATGPVVDLAAPAVWKLLRQGSKASLAKVLGASPTAPEAVNKAVAKVVPVALDEGLKPTWASWLKARKGAQNLSGKALEDALAGPLGDSVVPLKPVHEALEELKNSAAQHIMRAEETLKGAKGPVSGQVVNKTAVYNKRLLKQIDALQTILKEHGDVIQARQLVDLKRSWDDFVYKAAEFPNTKKILTSLEARAKSSAANAARAVLDKETPTLTDLDKAYSLNTRLYELIRKAAKGEEVGEAAATTGRRVSGALGRKAAVAATGATIGTALGYQQSHSVTGSVVGGLVGGTSARMLQTAMASPAWRTLPAVTKQALADAIANGNAEQARKAITAITAKVAAGAKKDAEPSSVTDTGKKTSSLTGLEKASGIGPTTFDRMTGEMNADRKKRGLGPIEGAVRAEMPILPAGRMLLKVAEQSPEAAMKVIESARQNPKLAEVLSSRRWEELLTKFGGKAESTVSAAQEKAMQTAQAEHNATPAEMQRLKALLFPE